MLVVLAARNKGDAISLVGPKDWDSFKRIETYLQQDLAFSVFEDLKGKFKGLKPPKKDFRNKKATTKKRVLKRRKWRSNQLNATRASTKTYRWVMTCSSLRKSLRHQALKSHDRLSSKLILMHIKSECSHSDFFMPVT